mgnify:CR=1 FL=1
MSYDKGHTFLGMGAVSMKSGLEGRNNPKGWGSVHSTRFESQ